MHPYRDHDDNDNNNNDNDDDGDNDDDDDDDVRCTMYDENGDNGVVRLSILSLL